MRSRFHIATSRAFAGANGFHQGWPSGAHHSVSNFWMDHPMEYCSQQFHGYGYVQVLRCWPLFPRISRQCTNSRPGAP
jgi:hypothetical protein